MSRGSRSRFFFFFSSRRRHTRLVSDWSSDVCSSDLPGSKLVMSRAGEFGNEAMIENNICEQANKLVEQKGNAAGNQPNGGSKERDQHHAELGGFRSEEHTSELQSLTNLVCRLLLEKK